MNTSFSLSYALDDKFCEPTQNTSQEPLPIVKSTAAYVLPNDNHFVSEVHSLNTGHENYQMNALEVLKQCIQRTLVHTELLDHGPMEHLNNLLPSLIQYSAQINLQEYQFENASYSYENTTHLLDFKIDHIENGKTKVAIEHLAP